MDDLVMGDLVTRIDSWDRCYPGNLNIEMLVDDCRAEITRLTAALAEAEAERDRLREALRPFAERVSHNSAPWGSFPAEDLRRAHAAYTALTRPAAQPPISGTHGT